MVITYLKKDITTITHGLIGHGCNCKGFMGSGVAFAIKRKWKNAYNEYNTLCKNYALNTKDMLGMTQIVQINEDITVANCFTQDSCGNDGKVYADIDAVLESIEHMFAYATLTGLPIYIPKIGCGLGGLCWETQVHPVIQSLVLEYPTVDVYVCDL